MAKSEEVKKAEEELEYLSGDEAVRRLAYLREKAIRDEAAAVATAKRMGKEEKSIEIAKKLKSKNMDINEIAEITGLTKDQLENL